MLDDVVSIVLAAAVFAALLGTVHLLSALLRTKRR